MTQTDWNDFIVCPHCGAEDHEYTDYPESLRHDGDSAELECIECEKAFRVTLCCEYTYQGSAK